MTTGSRTRNIYMPSGLGHSGRYESTSWSGVDTPRMLVPRPPRLRYKTTRIVTKTIRKGRNRGKVYTKVVPYSFTVRSPDSVASSKRKHMPENAFTKDVLIWDCTPVQLKQRFYSNKLVGSDWIHNVILGNAGMPGTAALLTANDQNKLINKLWSKVKGSDFNLSVFLGEAPQTVALVADTAIRIAKSIYHVRKGDASGALRSLVEGTTRAPLVRRFDSTHSSSLYPNLKSDVRDQSRLWLELQYGWKPLLSDTEAAAQMLSQQLEFPLRKVVRTRTFRAGPERVSASGNYWTNNEANMEPGSMSRPAMDMHRRSIKAIFSEDFNPSTAAKLGLLDPELVAWELLPFSFVADWFIPIGSYLEARASASRLGNGTFVTSDHRTSWRGDSRSTGSLQKNVGNVSADDFKMSFSRSISSTLIAQKPKFVPLNQALSLAHVANAIALVTLAFTAPVKGLGASIQSVRGNHRGLFG